MVPVVACMVFVVCYSLVTLHIMATTTLYEEQGTARGQYSAATNV